MYIYDHHSYAGSWHYVCNIALPATIRGTMLQFTKIPLSGTSVAITAIPNTGHELRLPQYCYAGQALQSTGIPTYGQDFVYGDTIKRDIGCKLRRYNKWGKGCNDGGINWAIITAISTNGAYITIAGILLNGQGFCGHTIIRGTVLQFTAIQHVGRGDVPSRRAHRFDESFYNFCLNPDGPCQQRIMSEDLKYKIKNCISFYITVITTTRGNGCSFKGGISHIWLSTLH